jgi:uncharacterized protein (DUF1330 family)
MLYITQLIHLISGQESVFDEFESVAIPLIAKHGGEMILRIRPTDDAYLIATTEKPYEIHLVSFPDESAFQTFMQDDTRQQFLHLKQASIRSSVLIKGQTI